MTELYNIEAEQGVLGGALLAPERWELVSDMITGDDFSHPPFGMIFEAIKAIRDAGQPIDILVLKNELVNRGQFEYIGGSMAISALTDVVPTGAHIEYYGQIVLGYSIRRKLQETFTELISDVNNKDLQPEDLIESAESALFAISSRGGSDGTTHIRELVTDQLNRIDRQMESGVPATGLTIGYEAVDAVTTGLHPGELIIVACRPAMGKTTFALNALRRIGAGGNPVMMFNLEMSGRSLTANITAAQAQVNGQVMRRMNPSRDDFNKIMVGTDDLSQMPIYIDDTPGLSLGQFKSRARRAVKKFGVKAVFIDYIQLMTVSGKDRGGSREQDVSEISRGLKLTAKSLGIPVIALAQLNRKCDERKDHKPLLSDLRESGAIEQDADAVLLLHRPEYYDASDRPGIMEVIVAKQRNGPTSKEELDTHMNQLRIESHVERMGTYSPEGF